jgi:hypothetical protein
VSTMSVPLQHAKGPVAACMLQERHQSSEGGAPGANPPAAKVPGVQGANGCGSFKSMHLGMKASLQAFARH